MTVNARPAVRSTALYTEHRQDHPMVKRSRDRIKTLGLGVLLGNNFNELDFWNRKHRKYKAMLAGGRPKLHHLLCKRVMLANNIILSRSRLWAQIMHMPTQISTAIAADGHVLIWGEDCSFDSEKDGIHISSLIYHSRSMKGTIRALIPTYHAPIVSRHHDPLTQAVSCIDQSH